MRHMGQITSTYLLKHWEPLTLFLRKAGALLDNRICERAKKAILHRKNSLFYKTPVERAAQTAKSDSVFGPTMATEASVARKST